MNHTDCPRTQVQVDDLALEYLNRRSNGDGPDTNGYLARLSSTGEKMDFREILQGVSRVEASLPALLHEGTEFAHFRLEEKIGNGGMGLVYKAQDLSLGRAVAVKILSPRRPDLLERFHQESRILGRLHHPGIVSVHEAGSIDRVPYLVMDLVDGETLQSVLQRLRKRKGLRLCGRALTEAIGRPVPAGAESLISGNWYACVRRIMCSLTGAID